MSRTAQRLAVANYRARLEQEGLARFEVIGKEIDRDLLRRLARRLAEGSQEAAALRDLVRVHVSVKQPARGRILAAFRALSATGIELSVARARHAGRKVSL